MTEGPRGGIDHNRFFEAIRIFGLMRKFEEAFPDVKDQAAITGADDLTAELLREFQQAFPDVKDQADIIAAWREQLAAKEAQQLDD